MNIIIIGATSGIGKALYEKYAADGNHNLSAKLKSNRPVWNCHDYSIVMAKHRCLIVKWTILFTKMVCITL